RLDGGVLAFTLGLSLLTGLLAGTLPGLPSREALSRALVDSGRSSAGTESRLRSGLVIWQLALSFVLLIGAALMLRSFGKLQQGDPSLRSEKVLTMYLDLNFSRYATPEQRVNVERVGHFYDGLQQAVHAMPGVLHVAEAWTVPLNSEFRNDGTF